MPRMNSVSTLAPNEGGANGILTRSGVTAAPRQSATAAGLTVGVTRDAYRDPDGETSEAQSGTSIFDPVLTELVYRWFCPPGGHVLDPFAGGSVRGIVAAMLGRRYTGIDLSAAQLAANEQQSETIVPGNRPRWVHGDSSRAGELAPGEYDLVFSCPPYLDLEVYSDDPADISNMPPAAAMAAYRACIGAACALLRPDRFACFVVGDVRGADGLYRDFVGATVDAFRAAGLGYYNEAVLVTAVGSLPIRVGKQFVASRKLGKTHQNILVFVKGDPAKATAACGPVVAGPVPTGGA